MRFLWPEMLWFLLAVPVLVGAYVLLLRRKKNSAVRYASLSLIRQAMSLSGRFRRHVPPLLLLLVVIVTIVAVARPSVPLTLLSRLQTIVVAMDVSLSMSATDVDPNRLTAAQAAARAFVDERPPSVRIGIVAFGGSAALVQPPTQSREDLIEAIDRFKLQRGTASGSAIYAALATLFPDDGIDLESLNFKGGLSRNPERGSRLDSTRKPQDQKITPVPPGSYKSGAIILMSDGRRTVGPDPLEAARFAAERGVRVFTVGFGTKEGAAIGGDGWSIYVRLDEETLKAVADITGGEYFHAKTAADLKTVYQNLTARLVLEKKDTEITSLLTAAAAVLLLASSVLSLLWFNRLA